MDPKLIAAFAFAGITGDDPAFVEVAHAMGKMLTAMADKIQADHEEASREFFSRCRHLVEVRGRPMTSSYRHFRDSMIVIDWNFGLPIPLLTIKDGQTFDVLGHASGVERFDCRIGGQKLQDMLVYLRQSMVLDDLASIRL
jgi:hypothetical protein